MPNTLGNYNEIFFAQEALTQLESALGMASRIHRGYDATPSNRGDTIRIRRPSTFAAADEPSTAQDLNTDSITLTLNKWRGVKFSLTDKELTLSADRLITDHIRPAAYEIARDIDADLATLIPQVPWVSEQAAAQFALSDLTAPARVLFDNGVPEDNMRHLQIDGAMKASILGVLGGANIMGAGVDGARRTGDIGELYGLNIYANQQTPQFTTGQMADSTGAVVGVHAKGVKSIALNGFTASQVGGVKEGDTFVIAGNRQRYVATAAASTDGAGAVTVAFEPALAAATAGGEVVTIDKRTGAKTMNCAYHSHFAALGMAPLSTLGQELGGVRMSVATDPKTGLALRSRMFYDAPNSKVVVGIDALWGKVMLNHNMATRFYSF